MNERDFCYWLQGYMENVNPQYINEDITKSIKDHLNLVFKKATPQATYCYYPNEGGNKPTYNKLFVGHTGISAIPLC